MRSIVSITLFALLLALSGCDSNNGNATAKKKPVPKDHLVMVTTVKQLQQSRSYERYGVVRARRIVHLHALEEGQIRQIPWYEGDTVKQGDLLVQLDDELVRADLMSVEAELGKATQNLNRIQKLAKSKAVSEEEIISASTDVAVFEAAKRRLETRIQYSHIVAPFSGIISERKLEVGDFSAKDDHLLTLVDPTSLVVEITVSELLLPRISIGDKATIRIDALGNRQLEGSIQRIHPTIDELTGQGIVEVAFSGANDGAMPGQTARVELTTSPTAQLTIPYSALQQEREATFVYLVNEESKVEKRSVKTGIFATESVEILQGLEDGDTVINRGLLGLKDGSTVKVVPSTDE